MSITPERLTEFSAVLAAGASDAQRKGILNYVKSICPSQIEVLAS